MKNRPKSSSAALPVSLPCAAYFSHTPPRALAGALHLKLFERFLRSGKIL